MHFFKPLITDAATTHGAPRRQLPVLQGASCFHAPWRQNGGVDELDEEGMHCAYLLQAHPVAWPTTNSHTFKRHPNMTSADIFRFLHSTSLIIVKNQQIFSPLYGFLGDVWM